MAIVPAPGTSQNEEEDLVSLRTLLREGDIPAARAFVKELGHRWPNAPWVQHYLRVLAPPVATMRPAPPSSPHEREYAWLQEHAHAYPGCWLAVLDDQLIAADQSFGVVLGAVRGTPAEERALLYFQPGSAE